MTHPTDDPLREAAQAVLDRWDSLDWKAAPTADYMNRLRAALAAAPRPAPAPADERGGAEAGLLAALDDAIANAEADIIADEEAGERTDLHVYEVCLPLETARKLHAALARPSAPETQPVCFACEDRPKAPNIPCAVCNKGAAPETLAWAVDGQGERRVALVYDEEGNVEVYADPGVTVISVCDHTPKDRLYRVSPQPIPEGMLAGPIGYAGDETRADRIANAALEAAAEGVDIAASPEAVFRKVREN